MAILTTTQDALSIRPYIHIAEEHDSECLNSLAVIRPMTIHLAILQILHLTLTGRSSVPVKRLPAFDLK